MMDSVAGKRVVTVMTVIIKLIIAKIISSIYSSLVPKIQQFLRWCERVVLLELSGVLLREHVLVIVIKPKHRVSSRQDMISPILAVSVVAMSLKHISNID
jgi:hypothetical protein